MHILFISDNFYPESNALANRLYDHAKIWVTLGHQVSVLTCAPNFPRGKVFEGYQNKWRQVEVLDGIQIVRIKSYIAENKGSLKRIIDYMSFALHAAWQGLWVKSPDVVIGTSPQPFPVFSAWFVARLKRKPFIFELRDLWPESVTAVGAMNRSSRLLRFFGWAIEKMYAKADRIIAVTESFKQILVEKHHISSAKIIVCKNGVDPGAIKATASKSALKKQYKLGDKYLVGYVGTIGMAHSVQTIVEAAKLNRHKQIHFVIMGAGAEAEQMERLAQPLQNVTFISSGTRQDALNVLNMLDVAIVHLRNTPLFETVIPSKIFEAMALGKPILMGVRGESRDIVIKQAKAGVAFKPEDPDELNQAIETIQERYYDAQKIKQFVDRHYNREIIAEQMLEAMHNAVGE